MPLNNLSLQYSGLYADGKMFVQNKFDNFMHIIEHLVWSYDARGVLLSFLGLIYW